MRLLVDTHALLWWKSDGARLSVTAARQLAAADMVLISPISCWEVATLVAKQRIALDREVAQWVRDLFEEPTTEVAGLSPMAAVQAADFAGIGGDPADRLLCATAAELAVPFVSKDRHIRAWARETKLIRTVW